MLRPGGWLAVFDGDYTTITLATGDFDPFQACVAAFEPAYITDPWVVRRLPAMVDQAGFAEGRLRSHGFVQTAEPDYMLTIADRGAMERWSFWIALSALPKRAQQASRTHVRNQRRTTRRASGFCNISGTKRPLGHARVCTAD